MFTLQSLVVSTTVSVHLYGRTDVTYHYPDTKGGMIDRSIKSRDGKPPDLPPTNFETTPT